MDLKLRKLYEEVSKFSKNGNYIDVDLLAESHNFSEFPLYHQLYDQLDDLYRTMNYLNKEIIGEFTLYENDSGRFEAFEGTYYTSGSIIEFQHDTRWYKSRIENADGEYYIVNFKDVPLPGLLVRVRG